MANDGVEPVVFSWSGGKDSALALHALLNDARYRVVALLTTVADDYRRISHHGVRESLLDLQAQSLGLALDKLYLPSQRCTNADYEARMGETMARYVAQGVRLVAHGDIFLEDLRTYQERNLARAGMQGLFPIWGRDTRELLEAFFKLGFRGCLCCVDAQRLGADFAGRELDARLLADLPPGVDLCGENGEYHSFVWDGPIFRQPVPVRLGQRITREGRHFVDLIPVGEPELAALL
ncbi:MAG TPA: adenine nucleotide alpha hydrolase [Gammaproteobacteria bacterium]|nr:adenine nucleotide alpha hydrolase [Gammaproteobacteria bacterium]